MEDKPKSKQKLSEKQVREIFSKLMLGEEEEAFEIFKNGLFKDEKLQKELGEIVDKKYKEYRENFFELDIPQKINFVVDEIFKLWIERYAIQYSMVALTENIEKPENMGEIYLQKIRDNIEKDIDHDLSYMMRHKEKNKDEKKDS